MANILLCWELGGGLGHLGRLAPVAQHLSGGGHQIDLASRRLRPVQNLFGNTLRNVYQAPIQLSPAGDGIFRTIGFAHILNNVGYSSVDALAALVRAWLVLFDVSRTEFVIADHSPTAVLAAYIAEPPCITIGNGFKLPPVHQAPPSFGAKLTADARASIERSNSLVCANVNSVLGAFEKPAIQTASDLYSTTIANLLLTLPELDHYGPRSDATYFGLPVGATGAAPHWPSQPGLKVYAYLNPSPGLKPFFASVRQLPMNLLVVHNELSRDLTDQAAAENIQFTRERLNLQKVAIEADCALLNGSHATMCQLLFGGVPLVLGPLHPEQLLASQRIVAAGAGLIVNHTDPKQMLAGIYEVTSQTRYRAAAQEFAARYAKFDQAKLDAQMYAEIDRAIGSS